MKIVVIGTTCSKTIVLLRGDGHDTRRCPRYWRQYGDRRGVDVALEGAAVVIDLANSRSLEPSAGSSWLPVVRRTSHRS